MKLANDISRCINDRCHLRGHCARFMCKEIGERTSMTNFPHKPKMDWRCEHFIQYTETK